MAGTVQRIILCGPSVWLMVSVLPEQFCPCWQMQLRFFTLCNLSMAEEKVGNLLLPLYASTELHCMALGAEKIGMTLMS